jgi:hypothetical protein
MFRYGCRTYTAVTASSSFWFDEAAEQLVALMLSFFFFGVEVELHSGLRPPWTAMNVGLAVCAELFSHVALFGDEVACS